MRSDYPCEELELPVESQVREIREKLDIPDNNTLLDTWLLPVCTVSPYMQRTARRYPDCVRQLLTAGALEADSESPGRDALVAELNTELENGLAALGQSVLDAKALEAFQQKVIRRFRHRQLFRILWRDLTNVAPLYRTLKDLSLLADACVEAADAWVYTNLCKRFGEPVNIDDEAQRLVILGMGKLGGYELNVSSDIDLICLYAESGQTRADAPGQKVLDNAEFFSRSVQSVTRLLNSVTEDGFAFRVDTRLRPFGASGPLVMNFEGLENYYLTQARDWERYAMIKARAITGLPDHIDTLNALITPFVYRRYLDYNAFESLRELKKKIALSVLQKKLEDNIKLGSGGIREVEFIGQAFQLVRGGQDERLRERSIVTVLGLLARQGLLPKEEVASLLASYDYLRRVENAVQMMRDEQVHSLPGDALDQKRLIMIMDEPEWSLFRDKLATYQSTVARIFAGLFEVEDADFEQAVSAMQDTQQADRQAMGSATPPEHAVISQSADMAAQVWSSLCNPDIDNEQRSAALEAAGFEPSEELLSAIDGLSSGAFYQRLTSNSQERVERIVPLILRLVGTTDDPSGTLIRCLALVRSVAGRSGYLQVLIDQPGALSRLVGLFAESRWLANFVLRQPMVIDELLTAPEQGIYPDAASVRADALEQLDRLKEAELDVQMDTLRHYRQSREMRIACAQLDGSLALMQVSDQLTWLAESLIEVVLKLVEGPLLARHGGPHCGTGDERRRTHVGVVAYGKLGGIELGFGSDLDLVFLHDSAGDDQSTDGNKSIDNAVFYARLAQKFVHFMSTLTPAGVLYEIDLRLRPNGSSGVLVTAMHAFANYQKGDAWTWEHQALMRARMVYGVQELQEEFAEVRRASLVQPRSKTELREAVASMRERMRSHLGSGLADQLHLKQDAGGVADIEFIVQYLVLANASTHPKLLTYTDNIRVLDMIEELSLLSSEDASLLRSCYIDLRERLHRQALQEASSTVPLDDTLVSLRDNVIAIRQRILGPG